MVAASPDKANWDKNLFAYCDNDPVSRKDDGGDLWEEITTLGDSISRSALIFGGLAIGAAVLSAFVVGTGGAGAIAIPFYSRCTKGYYMRGRTPYGLSLIHI